jgi:hypothetical protein
LGATACPAPTKIRQMEETKHDLQSVIIAWSGVTRNERTAQ